MEPLELISIAMNSHPSHQEGEGEKKVKEKRVCSYIYFHSGTEGVTQSESLSLSFPAVIDQSPSCHLDDKINIKP